MQTASSNTNLSHGDLTIKSPTTIGQTWAIMRRLYTMMIRKPFSSFLQILGVPGLVLGICYYILLKADENSQGKSSGFESALPLIGLLLTGFHVYTFSLWLVLDKQTQIKSLMLSMGLKQRSYYSGYLLCLLSCILPVMLILATLSVIYLFESSHSSPNAIILLFVLFSVQVSSITLTISSFITSSKFIAFVFIPLALENYLHYGIKWMLSVTSSSAHPLILFGACFSPYEALRIYCESFASTKNANLTLFTKQRGTSQPDYLILIAMTFWSVVLFLFAYWFDEVCPYKNDTEVKSLFFCCRKSRSHSLGSNKVEIDAQQNADFFENRSTVNREVGIRISNVSKAFKNIPAVSNLSLDIYKGETTLLLGHNGAGKTTLMNIMLSKLTPDHGYVDVRKIDPVPSSNSLHVSVGVCPQTSILDDSLTVLQHLELFADIKCTFPSAVERARQVRETLKDVSLASELHKLPAQLSGGMKRKLSLAMSFIGGSKILILDEPSSGLDPDSRVFVWDAIRRYRGDKTVLLSTQHMEEADYLGDRIAIMSSGRVICCGSSIFLNRLFGTGYKLRVSCSISHRKKTLAFVRKYFESAKLINDEQDDVDSKPSQEDQIQDITIELGGDKSKDLEKKLITLLEDIEMNSSSLNIISCGLKSSSIEDVMLNTDKVIHDTHKDSTRLFMNSERRNISELVVPPHTSNLTRVDQRIFLWALIKKHIQLYKNEWISTILFRLVLPISCLWFTIALQSYNKRLFIPGFIPAFIIIHYVSNPTLEKVTGFKTVQSTGGGGIIIYWLSQLIVDLASIILNVIVVNIFLYTSLPGYILGSTIQLHLIVSVITFMFGLAAALLAYVVSTVLTDAKSPSGQYSLLYLTSIISTVLVMLIAITVVHDFDLLEIPNRVFAAILPSDAFQYAVFGLMTDCYIVELANESCERIDIFSPLTFSLIALPLQIIAYGTLLYLIEVQIFDLAWYLRCIKNAFLSLFKWRRSKSNLILNQITDQDVTEESMKALQLINKVPQDSYSLVASKLNKSYVKGVDVVKNLSFTVKKGECFGLLGVNGAGKSTTFSMLIAEAKPDSGRIWLNGLYNSDDVDKYRSTIGYDPQSNLDISLSPSEALFLMARLRRVKEQYIQKLVNSCLEVLEMSEHASKSSKELSGGTKRKLALGMSLIGTPKLLALDEPTAGVDPMARRSVWHLLRSLRMQNGTSIVISSHAMEECEAICDRISIMARGQIRCIGTFLHLRSKFSQGCSIRVQFASTSIQGNSVQDVVNILSERLQSTLGTSVKLVDRNVNSATFNVSDDRVKRSKIFKLLREFREREQPGISYMVNDSSLEDIFIALAREQQQISGNEGTAC